MRSARGPSFVADVLDAQIIVVCGNRHMSKRVRALGGRRRWGFFGLFEREAWKVRYASLPELASLLSDLRDAGFAMGDALGTWSPAAVFEELRERGSLCGGYTSLFFTDDGVMLRQR